MHPEMRYQLAKDHMMELERAAATDRLARRRNRPATTEQTSWWANLRRSHASLRTLMAALPTQRSTAGECK